MRKGGAAYLRHTHWTRTFRGDQGNIADILVHDGIRRKLDKQLLHVFLGFRGIGSVQEPFNIAVKEQGIENGVDTLKR